MDNRHDTEPRVERSRLELLALLGSAGAAAACSPTSPQMMGQDTVDAVAPSPKDRTPSRAPLKPLTSDELKTLGLDKEGGEGGGGGDGGGH